MTAEADLTFVGTATTLIRFADLTVLTDPNFLHQGERAYFGYGLSGKRLTEPALSVEHVPRLDAVVLSHLHGDHWDRRAHRGLDHGLPVLTTPHAARRLRLRGFGQAVGLRTWQSHRIASATASLRVTSLPGRHATGLVGRLLPPVMGSHLEFRSADGASVLRMYLTGDTLLVDDLREIPSRFPHIDVGVWHLGGTTLPIGRMVTMDGRQGAELVELVRPGRVVPVHFDDYALFRSPRSDFEDELRRRGHADRLRVVERGQTIGLTD